MSNKALRSTTSPAGPELFAERRRCMVNVQVAERGVRDAAVLAAMRQVPRHAFVPWSLREAAYEDEPLPIGEGQTISQPYVVACMLEAVQVTRSDRALEIGTGSGYSAAVLSTIAAEVYTVERIEALARVAGDRLAELGYTNVHVRHGDGTLGWPEHAPYDVIIVTAGGRNIPPALLEQLAIGGRLIMPVGPSRQQRLIRVTRRGPDDYEHRALEPVTFVPLIGAEGRPDEGAIT
jgi:protein-L-isoaspartate(D-aspartate) O-methyltransferase